MGRIARMRAIRFRLRDVCSWDVRTRTGDASSVMSVWQGLLVTLWLASAATGGGAVVKGRVADETGAPIPG